jgi:UDP-N-acetylglucosamine 1-carboxyvinyltransferase
MDQLRIIGGNPLEGDITIGGAKNAALPLLAACLLSDQPITLYNMPYLADVTTMAKLLTQLGMHLCIEDAGGVDLFGKTEPGNHHSRVLRLHTPKLTQVTAAYDLVRTMRASVLVLGPLLARAGQAKVSLPGGCAIGTRPIDLHLFAMEKLGAEITLEDGYVLAKAPKGGLQGAEIIFDKISVGATENALMAAVLANGTTHIINAASEPEVADLIQMLNAMGADIKGSGTNNLEIKGVSSLHGARHEVIADRIETGTFCCAVALTGGKVKLHRTRADTLKPVLDTLRHIGLDIQQMPGDILAVQHDGSPLRATDIETQPHPGFPTDMQAQLMTVLARAKGVSHIAETIFENRFMHVPELSRMGADIKVDGHTATISGVDHFTGATVMATDLRASVSLVIAGLAAKGATTVTRIYHLDRGYERIEEKLSNCGANIMRVKG